MLWGELGTRGDGAVIKECGHGRRAGVWMYLRQMGSLLWWSA